METIGIRKATRSGSKVMLRAMDGPPILIQKQRMSGHIG